MNSEQIGLNQTYFQQGFEVEEWLNPIGPSFSIKSQELDNTRFMKS